MLLAVLQPEFHWFSDDPSTFTALVEQAVCREEFDALVLPTPSIACERVDEVAVVNWPTASFACAGGSRGAVHECAGQIAIEPVAVDAYLQPMADQSRRRAVQDAAHGEGAAAGHACLFLDEVRGAVLWKIQQVFALDLERWGIAPVSTHHDAAHKLVVGRPVDEVAMTAQLKSPIDLVLQVAMR
ncbi:hypothetical protein SAMN05446635_8965 [Burkholderia sp. OK233]|nr:hypothetical protein SAMN05446635_8965 [Burkholderia sp. OK233]